MNNQYINSINSLDREILSLEIKINDLDSKINNKQKDSTRLLEKSNREKNVSSLINSQKQIQRLNDETSRFEKERITVSKNLTEKRKRKLDLQQKIFKEEEIERKKSKQDLKEQLEIQERITREIERQRELSVASIRQSKNANLNENAHYDVFISHASEDKIDFVKPFADSLINFGLKVWYDEFELKIGDSLRRSIDRGLVNSKYGIVVLSPSFFAKQWTQYELDGLVAREMNGVKVILPLMNQFLSNSITLIKRITFGIIIFRVFDPQWDYFKPIADS